MSGIGTPAVQSSGSTTISGNVPVTQVTDPWNVNLTKVGTVAITLGQKAMAASIPVVISSDQTAIPVSGTVSITANSSVNVAQFGGSNVTIGQQLAASSIPVVLTAAQISTLTPVSSVTATLQTQTDTVMVGGVNVKEINAVTPLMGNGITGTGSQRVTIASDNTAFSVNSTLQTQTDTVMVGGVNIKEINGVTPLMGVGATGTGAPRVVQANDAGKTLVSKSGTVASSGNNTLVAAGTNRLKVYAFSLSTVSTTENTCIFQSGAGGTELWRVDLQAPTSVSTGANLAVPPPAWLFATASATLLNLNLSAAQTVHYSISYYDEA